MLKRIRRSLALKLILASAIPSALVLLTGVGALVTHSYKLSLGNPALAFEELRTGAILGTLLALTFAGMTIALAARHFLIKPIQNLMWVMRRAEMGEFLVRAQVQTEDELGKLAHGFNTMLARVTDMAVAEIENRADVSLQEELREVNRQLEAHLRELELLLDVSKAVASTLDLPELLETLGRQICDRFAASAFALLLTDENSHQLVVEAVAGEASAQARGQRLHIGEGLSGEAAAQGQTRQRDAAVSIPLRTKGRILGVMELRRLREPAFSPQEIRLAEAIAAQAALAIANARLYQQTLELSFTDPLTGVANRRQLFLWLEQEHSRSVRFGDPLSVLMIDLDLFKAVNDAHGHAVGDVVLRAVAHALKRNVRKVDLVARYGGEEFCIVLPRIGKPEALEVADKLRRAVSAARMPSSDVAVTISVGVATLGIDADDVPGLVDKADAALYEAKRQGRDRVAMAVPAQRASA